MTPEQKELDARIEKLLNGTATPGTPEAQHAFEARLHAGRPSEIVLPGPVAMQEDRHGLPGGNWWITFGGVRVGSSGDFDAIKAIFDWLEAAST